MEKKIIKSVKLKPSVLKTIEREAKKQKRTTHYLMVECLEKGFK